MNSLLAMLCLLAPADEETFAVTLAFQEMHCEECRVELETGLKRIRGFKAVSVTGKTVTVRFEEKAPIPALQRLPRDLDLVSTRISIRGTVTLTGEQATLVARSSGARLELRNPRKVDRVGELKKQLGGKNRFRVAGRLVDARAIVLERFEKADWKGD